MKKLQLILASAALTFFGGSPAFASVTIEAASLLQGTLVHGTGVLQVSTEVIANLGAGGPTIVHFTGDTTETAGTVDTLRLQDGQGQADITGAEITVGGPANDLYNLLSGDIFLTGHAGMDWIEFGLTGLTSGTVDFIITLSDATTVSFLDQLLGSGDTFFGFLANGGTSITNVHYSADTPPAELTILKQVRINETVAAVPEPGTWAMMLLGFGAAGFALRRRKRPVMGSMQIA
ncbi:MAG TPA: PEPxxWA-CTERM sorting domain-containing protein [Sphingomicrobium sp.]|nr:PEPxxWA-CTERM sorting domain-containing protein [Sphingomicrobium sp.]